MTKYVIVVHAETAEERDRVLDSTRECNVYMLTDEEYEHANVVLDVPKAHTNGSAPKPKRQRAKRKTKHTSTKGTTQVRAGSEVRMAVYEILRNGKANFADIRDVLGEGVDNQKISNALHYLKVKDHVTQDAAGAYALTAKGRQA